MDPRPAFDSIYRPLWLTYGLVPLLAGWLTLIALNLISMGIFDVAVRDLAMAVGAYSLAPLAEARQEAPAPAAVRLGESRA